MAAAPPTRVPNLAFAGFTVADALDLPTLRRALPRVLSGERQLGRPIRWVHAAEVPHIASQLRGGELLLTTGIGIGPRPSEQRRFVARLATVGAAALIVELGTKFATVPNALVQEARAHDLPLIALTREVAFIAVTEAIHTEIVNAQYVLMRRGDEIQERLTQMLLDGQGIPDVLRTTSELVGNPVFLEDSSGRLLHHADDSDSSDALELWNASRSATDGHGTGICVDVASASHQAPARLVVLPVARPIDATAETIVQRAAGIVALSLLRSRQEEELVARERGNLLVDLAGGRVSGEQAQRHAASIGFRTTHDLLLPVAADAVARVSGSAWGRLLRDVRTALEDRGLAVLAGPREHPGQLLAAIGLGRRESRGEIADTVATAIRVAAERQLGSVVVVTVGAPQRWADLGPALRQAADTLPSAIRAETAAWHDVRKLDLSRLFWHWRDDTELRAFVDRQLGALIAHDDRSRYPLLPTLDALCRHGGRKTDAAKALHLNRQALYGRVARIEALLDVQLDDPERMLALHVALRALPHVGREPN